MNDKRLDLILEALKVILITQEEINEEDRIKMIKRIEEELKQREGGYKK